MNHTLKWMAAVLAVFALGAVAAAGQPPAETFGLAGPAEKAAVTKPELLAPSARWVGVLAGVPRIELAPLDELALLAEDELTKATDIRKMLRVGVARALAFAARDGRFDELADGGRLWSLEVVSPGAVGLRLRFENLRLPAGAELALVAVDRVTEETAQVEIVEAAAGETDLWSPTLAGERARIELYLPPGAARSDDLPFAVREMQHLYRDPLADSGSYFEKGAGACHNDVTCYSQWASTARGVALITFVSGGGTFLCSGQLLNDLIADFTPYFLTANHCISTASEASSLEAYWLYQTSTCGGAPPAASSVPRSRRSTLLRTGAGSDYSLLLIEGTVPRNLTWLGWTTATIANNTASTAIHHPAGDFKRISFGRKSGSAPQSCGSATSPNFTRVNWTDGPTEGGSSGSGIFRNDTKQLYGQLSCGPSACGNETNDSYGSFRIGYPNYSSFLAGGADDNHEQNDGCSTARTVSTGTYNSRIVKVNDTDWYKINVPAGRRLRVTVTFTHGNGDIDVNLFRTCGAAPIAISDGATNSEQVTVLNGGSARTYYWQVYLFNDTRNAYSMNVTLQ